LLACLQEGGARSLLSRRAGRQAGQHKRLTALDGWIDMVVDWLMVDGWWATLAVTTSKPKPPIIGLYECLQYSFFMKGPVLMDSRTFRFHSHHGPPGGRRHAACAGRACIPPSSGGVVLGGFLPHALAEGQEEGLGAWLLRQWQD
jgi:hypothetical protein